MSLSGQALHPNPQEISSTKQSEPSQRWAAAVDRARQIARAGVAAQNLPGLSVAVGAGGDLVWSEGFGWADIESRQPVTPDTRFRIGTASTTLTSAAAGMLLEKGRLKLDDEIQSYIPDFPKKKWPVTVRQLMAHTGGIGTDDGDEGPLIPLRCERPAAALGHFAKDPLLFEPGTQYRHSKYGWILVSAAVEAVAEQPFLTFMSEQVFRPLGMRNTGAESAEEENPEHIGEPAEDAPFLTFFRQMVLQPLGVASPAPRPAAAPAIVYVPGFGPDPAVRYGLHTMRPQNLSCYAGSMAFFSTPSDLVRFGLAIHSGTLLQPATVRLLQTSHRLAPGRNTGHGLGWDIDTVTQSVGYDGQLRGRTVMTLMTFRDTGIVVAVMSNASYADTPALARNIAESFTPPAPR